MTHQSLLCFSGDKQIELANPTQLKRLQDAEAAKKPQTKWLDFIHLQAHICWGSVYDCWWKIVETSPERQQKPISVLHEIWKLTNGLKTKSQTWLISIEWIITTLLIFNTQVVLMSQGFAAQAKQWVLHASSLWDSSLNLLRWLRPNGQSLLIRG